MAGSLRSHFSVGLLEKDIWDLCIQHALSFRAYTLSLTTTWESTSVLVGCPPVLWLGSHSAPARIFGSPVTSHAVHVATIRLDGIFVLYTRASIWTSSVAVSTVHVTSHMDLPIAVEVATCELRTCDFKLIRLIMWWYQLNPKLEWSNGP